MEFPVLIYDDLCSSCTEFAKMVDKMTRGKITIIGHYSPLGKSFKETIFPEGYKGLEMSWFVTPTEAFGGRAGLVRLVKYAISLPFAIFSRDTTHPYPKNNFDLTQCSTDCRTAKGVAMRSCSILTNTKTIKHNT